MKCLLFFLVASLSSISADDVVDLGDSDFDSKLADMETALVMFYAPWLVTKSSGPFIQTNGSLSFPGAVIASASSQSSRKLPEIF